MAFADAVAAVDLHGRVDDFLRLFRGEQLCHGGLAADTRRASVLGPGGAIDEKRRGIHGQRHVGEVSLHHLQLEQGCTEQVTLADAIEALIQRAAREAKGRRCNGRAEDVEDAHGDAEAGAGRADQRRRPNARIGKAQAREGMGRARLQTLGDFESFDAGGHDESGKPLGAWPLARAREDAIDVGDATVGDPGLLAIQDIISAVARGGERDVGHVRARLRLGQREGRDRTARTHQGQPVLLLRRRAEQGDRTRAEALHGEGEIGKRIVAGKRLADQAQAAHVERHSRAFRIHRGVLQETCFTELGDKLAAGGIRVGMIEMGERIRRPTFEAFGQRAVARFEKRPGEIASVGHQLPSNTGFRFSAKA